MTPTNSKIVIKLGGSALQNSSTLSELTSLVAGLRKQHFQVIVVHGGGPAINQELTQRGITWQFINGQRQTTIEMMEAIEQVLAKDVNSLLVNSFIRANIPAVGISGADNQTLLCSQASSELMQVGKIETVNTLAIEKVLSQRLNPVPVIAPIGIGAEGQKFNINADWAAAQIAIALGAKKLIFLTDQDGILDQQRHFVPRANPARLELMIKDGTISGGMFTKVKTMIAALDAGTEEVRVLNAHSASQLIEDDTLGTVLTKNLQRQGKDKRQWTQKAM